MLFSVDIVAQVYLTCFAWPFGFPLYAHIQHDICFDVCIVTVVILIPTFCQKFAHNSLITLGDEASNFIDKCMRELYIYIYVYHFGTTILVGIICIICFHPICKTLL